MIHAGSNCLAVLILGLVSGCSDRGDYTGYVPARNVGREPHRTSVSYLEFHDAMPLMDRGDSRTGCVIKVLNVSGTNMVDVRFVLDGAWSSDLCNIRTLVTGRSWNKDVYVATNVMQRHGCVIMEFSQDTPNQFCFTNEAGDHPPMTFLPRRLEVCYANGTDEWALVFTGVVRRLRR